MRTKPIFLSENEASFSKLLSNYNRSREEFMNLVSGKIPELFFAFDTRFMLSSSMEISFNNKIIRSRSARACYVRLMKITDIWVTYETLLKIVFEQGYFNNITAKASAISETDASSVFELDQLILTCNNQLKANCLTSESYILKLQDYLTFLSKNSESTQVAVINKALYSIKSRTNFSVQALVAMTYAIRNLFIEKGDTSIAHIKNMQLTESFFEILHDFMILASLKIATKLIDNKIEEITK